MCQNLFTGRTEIILFVIFFFQKYVYQLSEKTLFLSVFDFLGLRDPLFKELDIFMFVRTVGSSLY